jgi:hypothetical protein
MPGHCHINSDVLQRSHGQSAIMQLGYQMCTYAADDRSHADYSRFAGDHRGGVILLPKGANAEFADDLSFIMATCFREKRKDAQEGRVVNFALPREVPPHLLLLVAAFVMAHFVQRGMAVRIDIECPPASDAGLNPHAHCYLSQRVLEEDGFGQKGRPWNAEFRSNQGRDYRAIIAARLTVACALLGIAAFVDPRCNEEKGYSEPEERFLTSHFRMAERCHVARIEELKAKRRERKSIEMGFAPTVPASGMVTIENAVSSQSPTISKRAPTSNKRRVQRKISALQVAREIGIVTRESHGEIELANDDGAIVFDGETLTIANVASPSQAKLVVTLAKKLGWPALVVEGDSTSTDEIFLAGVPEAMVPINACASDYALALINNKFRSLLADAIVPLDPLSRVDIGAVPIVSFALEEAQPTGSASATSREPESMLEIVEFPEPPKSSAAEEEKKRAEAGKFFQQWIAALVPDVQHNSVPRVRENGEPVEEKKIRGP